MTWPLLRQRHGINSSSQLLPWTCRIAVLFFASLRLKIHTLKHCIRSFHALQTKSRHVAYLNQILDPLLDQIIAHVGPTLSLPECQCPVWSLRKWISPSHVWETGQGTSKRRRKKKRPPKTVFLCDPGDSRSCLSTFFPLWAPCICT